MTLETRKSPRWLDSIRKGRRRTRQTKPVPYPYRQVVSSGRPSFHSSIPDPTPSFLSKILLPPHKMKPGLRIHITLDMQLTAQDFRTAEKYARLSGCVDLADRAEDHVPVWTAEVGGCAETGDGVAVRVDVVDHDVGRVVGFDFGREVLLQGKEVSGKKEEFFGGRREEGSGLKGLTV